MGNARTIQKTADVEVIRNRIYEVRGLRVMLDATVNGHFIHLETDELLQKAKQKGIEEGPLQDKFDVGVCG